jgi:transcriptional regulator with XRE-family HTH domain
MATLKENKTFQGNKAVKQNELGHYLQDRRAKLDPKALGFTTARRRTPGLRREEVAQRANVSTTWYTWLEQGRGGAPSPTVLDCLARALLLTEAEREHLYLLALGRLPDVRYQPVDGISPRLQTVLDALEYCPALIRTSTWDIVGWNEAATRVLTDYAALDRSQRNILKLIFTSPKVRQANTHWEILARTMVAAFRADIARAGASGNIQSLIDELCHASPEFSTLWQDKDIVSHSGGTKELQHPQVGQLTMEFSSFTIDGRPDLNMIVYTPATPTDRQKVISLFKTRHTRKRPNSLLPPGEGAEGG